MHWQFITFAIILTLSLAQASNRDAKLTELINQVRLERANPCLRYAAKKELSSLQNFAILYEKNRTAHPLHNYLPAIYENVKTHAKECETMLFSLPNTQGTNTNLEEFLIEEVEKLIADAFMNRDEVLKALELIFNASVPIFERIETIFADLVEIGVVGVDSVACLYDLVEIPLMAMFIEAGQENIITMLPILFEAILDGYRTTSECGLITESGKWLFTHLLELVKVNATNLIPESLKHDIQKVDNVIDIALCVNDAVWAMWYAGYETVAYGSQKGFLIDAMAYSVIDVVRGFTECTKYYPWIQQEIRKLFGNWI